MKKKTKKKNEDDVWAFLNEDENENEENENFNFKLSSSDSKSSSKIDDKNYAKTPKNKFSKKKIEFAVESKMKSKFKINSSNIFGDIKPHAESISPKHRKKIKKKGTKGKDILNVKKCSTIIKRIKKNNLNNDASKSNKIVKFANFLNKKNSSNNINSGLSSLDLTINDNLEEKDTYIKKLYKKKKKEEILDDDKSSSKLGLNLSKLSKDK